MKHAEMKAHLKFLRLLNQARQARNWTTAKLDDNLYVVGKKEQVGYLLEVLNTPEEESKELPQIPEAADEQA